MISIAKKSDLFSDIYINLCHRNFQKEFCLKRELCWQIPWLFYTANVKPKLKVLCIGEDCECIKRVILNEINDSQMIVVTETEKENALSAFDLIVGCCEVKNVDAYQVFLNEGGLFIFTDTFKYSNNGIDLSFLKTVLKDTPLKFLRKPNGLDLLTYMFSADNYKDDVLVLNEKCFVGFVFYKEYSCSGIRRQRFSINHRLIYGSNTNVLLDYLETNQDERFKQIKGNQYFREFYLPSELCSRKYFTIEDLQTVYRTDIQSALDLINELVCGEYINKYFEE